MSEHLHVIFGGEQRRLSGGYPASEFMPVRIQCKAEAAFGRGYSQRGVRRDLLRQFECDRHHRVDHLASEKQLCCQLASDDLRKAAKARDVTAQSPLERTDKAWGTAPYRGILNHEAATSYGMGRFSLAQSFSMSDSGGGGTRPCVRQRSMGVSSMWISQS